MIGVVTLEFSPGSQLGPQAATGLSVAADLLAPQLYDRHENDRYLITKVGTSSREGYKMLIGPKHWLAKTLIFVAIVGLWVLAGAPTIFWGPLYKPMYQVVAPFSFAPVERRYVHAPFEGFIKEVYVRPGDQVKPGDKLFELDTTELRQQYTRAMGEHNAARAAYAKYMGERPQPKVAEAKVEEQKAISALAEAKLFQERIEKSLVKADIAGAILEGDLKDKKHAPVKLGEQVMTIGLPDKLRGELRVPERDIQDVKDGAKGELAITSLPQERFPFTVERIIPTIQTQDGSSHFKVIVTLEKSAEYWRPGMEGEARVDVAPASLGWKWTRRLVDFVRLKLWI
jgi:multidrug efflux pump subunit AcrA (membrane-fusion protein)